MRRPLTQGRPAVARPSSDGLTMRQHSPGVDRSQAGRPPAYRGRSGCRTSAHCCDASLGRAPLPHPPRRRCRPAPFYSWRIEDFARAIWLEGPRKGCKVLPGRPREVFMSGRIEDLQTGPSSACSATRAMMALTALLGAGCATLPFRGGVGPVRRRAARARGAVARARMARNSRGWRR